MHVLRWNKFIFVLHAHDWTCATVYRNFMHTTYFICLQFTPAIYLIWNRYSFIVFLSILMLQGNYRQYSCTFL